MDMDSKEITKITVSQSFVDIYKNFNVVTQVEKIKQLSRREQYLLLLVCLDKHSDEDPVVIHNFTDFKDECMQLFDIQDDKKSTDETLNALIKETGDQYIETDNIVGPDGEKLPTPFTKEEVRDAKIDIINDVE